MNYYIWIFLCGSLFYSCSGSDGEKPDKLLRVERTFNEDWYFILDTLETGEDQGWFHPERIPADIMKVEVPHTWNVMDGTENHYGLGWYFKFFDVPDSWEGKVTRIRFDAIYRDVKIWVNGDLVIERIGAGYTPFEIDLSDHLLFTGNNLMAIQVSNKFSGRAIPVDHKFDWAADGGIIRKVKLIKTESPYILYLHTEPRLKNRDQGDLAIRIGISGHQETGIGALDVWWQIREFKQTSRNIIHEGNRKLDINQDEIVFDLKLDGINRWHFNQPYLYQIKVAIGNKLILTDHAETTFGFRSLTVLDDKILFNGEHVRLPGIEWMPGSNPGQGMAEDTVTMISMLSLLKNTNSVLTRFHWQQDDFIFRWCDENGLLVQEEIPLWQAPFPGQLDVEMRLLANRHLEEMILAHRNHPSIIAWGIGNELSAQNDTIKGFLTELKKQVSTLDSTRLINYVSNTFHHEPDNDGTAIGDMLMWNDYSGLWYDMDGKGLSAEMLPEILIDFNRHIPGKPLIISEYGLCEPVFKGGDPARIAHFLHHTAAYDKNEFIGGLIYFSLNDYRTHMGEAGLGKYKQRIHGILDLEGKRKPSYWVVQERFSPVRELDGSLINGNFHVTGNNHNGLPSYTLYNYMVRIYGENDELLGEQQLPPINPGQGFNIVFRELTETVSMIRIFSSNEFQVITLKL